MAAVSDDLSRLAHEASVRALRGQEAALTELRQRTGSLLTATSLTSSFLGALALDRSGGSALSVVALIAFVGSIVPSVLILMPREQLSFAITGSALYDALRDVGDEADPLRAMTDWLDSSWDDNQAHISSMTFLFRLSASALILEILLWSLALGIS